MQPTSRISRARQGFTLIELLTVIAIIGILAAIIIPTVGAVRQSARESKNLSNLRQIALAFNILANDNKDRFIGAGNYNDTNGVYVEHWKTEIGKYLMNTKSNNWIDRDNIFVSPTAANPPSTASSKPCHYSVNPVLCAPNGTVSAGLRRSSVKRSSLVILVGDGGQTDTSGQNAADIFSTPAQFTQLNATGDPSAFIPATAATNTDTTRGQLRYRNRNSVHVGMVDGSARSFKMGTVTYGNIMAAR